MVQIILLTVLKKKSTKHEKIDYIFVSDNINVIHHAIIGDKFNDKYPSDHMPVIIDFHYKLSE